MIKNETLVTKEIYRDNMVFRGGLFDTWGTMVFLCDQTFFSTANLSIQFLSELIQSKQFFSQQSNTKQFFHHLFHLILPILQVEEVSTNLP